MIFKKEAPTQAATKVATTRLRVKFDCGFPNNLTIRGKGGNLSWERGLPLKNVKPNEWIWETSDTFTTLEFKLLINDRTYERGENHVLKNGDDMLYSPIF